LNPSSGRSALGSDSSRLLKSILEELVKVEENKAPLKDEIECIKNQDFDSYTKYRSRNKMILERPEIYKECIHYLKEYGTVKDLVTFLSQQFLWKEVVEHLLDNLEFSQEKFFINEVLLYAASKGNLNGLVTEFLNLDPNIERSKQYFKTIYDYCAKTKRFNLLNYIQYRIGDFVAAAESQINHHFLSSPASSYKTLNRRLPNLIKAIGIYREYLRKLAVKKHNISMKNDLRRKDVVITDLFSEMNHHNVEMRISLIEMQIEITKNFSLSEVSGCMSDLGSKSDDELREKADSFPVTLFDRSDRRKTFLAALVLIYYDPECNSYFSDQGVELTRRIVHRLQLNKLAVYKTAMRIIFADESCDLLESTKLLLDRLKKDYEEEVRLLGRPRHRSIGKIPSSDVLFQRRVPVQMQKKQPSMSLNIMRPSLQNESERMSLISNHSTISCQTTSSSSTSSSNSFISATPNSLQAHHDQSGKFHRGIGSVAESVNLRSSEKQQHVQFATLSLNNDGNLQPYDLELSNQSVSIDPLQYSSSYSKASGGFLSANSSSGPRKISLASSSSFNEVREAAKKSPLSQSTLTTSRPAAGSNTCSTFSLSSFESAQALCDEVVRDSITFCQEADYKMELVKLLSQTAQIELFIELGKLSNAQRLAFSMNRPDYVARIIEEADKLNQDHVKTLCQHWLAKQKS